MLEYECSFPPCTAEARCAAAPHARLLLGALEGCCHPRAERLRARLLDCRDAQNLAELRGEVLNLLTLSFGRVEAGLRLQQPPLQ
ncbi:MAG: hypothetical protein LBI48_05495 [Burkholderiaceae bacterium]|jgi:hypothetical protein|nr:hypothetical protein [Burkholderiaceae bacterium]